MKGKPGSLYIHVPFCAKKCIYCDFFSIPYDETRAVRYMDSAVKELEMTRDRASVLDTIYIGGGTPTTMPAGSLVMIARKIKDLFEVSDKAEVTIEANPGTIDQEKARALHDAGISRFSIGAQSFDDDQLRLLGRIHTSEETVSAIGAVRSAGVPNISIDLIYGIPGQTHDGWLHTIDEAVGLYPAHISAYELTPERGTPLYELISQGRIAKPDEENIVRMYYSAIEKLEAEGYGHYEISNFARPGFECRHNLNYWNRGEYIGIGAGAHGFIGGIRTRNACDVDKYINAIEGGRLPVEESSEISREDALKEAVFLGLRKMEGLNITEIGQAFGVDIVKAARELIVEGLLRSEGESLRLTRKGVVVSNTVIAELFERMGL